MLCGSEQVEDEKHFVLDCPMYRDERNDLYDKLLRVCELDMKYGARRKARFDDGCVAGAVCA